MKLTTSILSRRCVLGSTALLVATPNRDDITLSAVIEMIRRQTPKSFLRAVKSTKRFLYRGESLEGPRVLQPLPDLLLEGTYEDEAALGYFQCLENILSPLSEARPSNSHIATSRYDDAAAWGSVASVWPLGDELRYVWPQDSCTFFPESTCLSAYAIDHDLDSALKLGREILFVSKYAGEEEYTSSFCAVPSSFDDVLRQLL